MVKVRIDTSNFMKAQAIWQAHSRKSVPKNLNNAVRMVVFNAKNSPRNRSVPIARIDSELMVSSTPKVLKNGTLSKSKKHQLANITPHKWPKYAGNSFVPLAALIVNARVLRADVARSQPGMSRYNRLTGMRYAIPQSPFKGVSRRTGAAKMTQAISRMVKGRHSSAGFLRSSWQDILNALRGKSGPDSLGRAIPATANTNTPTCVIENVIGGVGKSPTMNLSRANAARRYLAPILQSAIDAEFERSLTEFTKRGYQEAAPLLAAHGVVVVR